MRASLRAAVVLSALGVVYAWIQFLRMAFAEASGIPASGAVVVALVFAGLALSAAVAAYRDVPIVVVLTAGISLIPVGLYLMLFEGPGRWIGLLDLSILVMGIALVRGDRAERDDDLSPPAPPTPDSGHPASP